ncbi:hypothetical protein L9F63_023260, partial [Diploptera punctata]
LWFSLKSQSQMTNRRDFTNNLFETVSLCFNYMHFKLYRINYTYAYAENLRHLVQVELASPRTESSS